MAEKSEIQIEQIPYYLTWKIRREVMYPSMTIDEVKLPDDANGIHYGLYVEQTLTVIVSLFEQGDVIQLRKFATLEKAQGKGLGKLLLSYVLKLYDSRGANMLWCNARLSASKFYEKFGFKKYGESWEASGHTFIKMERLKGSHHS